MGKEEEVERKSVIHIRTLAFSYSVKPFVCIISIPLSASLRWDHASCPLAEKRDLERVEGLRQVTQPTGV